MVLSKGPIRAMSGLTLSTSMAAAEQPEKRIGLRRNQITRRPRGGAGGPSSRETGKGRRPPRLRRAPERLRLNSQRAGAAMKSRADLTALLDALEARMPALLGQHPDDAEFWPAFAGEAEAIE